MMTDMTTRLAVVLAVLLSALACWFTLAPVTSPNTGTGCGSWVAPKHMRDDVQVTLQRLEARGATPEAELLLVAVADCTRAIDRRRNLALGLVAASLVIPCAVLYVGRSPLLDTRGVMP